VNPSSARHEGDHDTPAGSKEDPWQLKPAREGTVEAFGRTADNPVGGWYGLRKSYRGRFGMYVPPLLEALGRVELTHHRRRTGCAR
jgi:hypothetical protein